MVEVKSLSKIAKPLKTKVSRKTLLDSNLRLCSVCNEDMDSKYAEAYVDAGKYPWMDENDEKKNQWYGTTHKSRSQGGKEDDPENYRLICNECGPKIIGDVKGGKSVNANAYYLHRILAAIDRMEASGYETIEAERDRTNQFVKDAIEEYIRRRNKKVVPVVKAAYKIDVSKGEWDNMFHGEMFNHLNEGVRVFEKIKQELMKMTSVVESSQKKIKELEGKLPPDALEMVEGTMTSYIEFLRKEQFKGADFIITYREGETRLWLDKLESDVSEKELTVAEVETELMRDWSSEDKQ